MKTLAASLSILTKQGVMLYLLRGVAFTCIISVLGVIMGLIVGSLLALARTYCKKGPARILGWFAAAYIELFRNTCLLYTSDAADEGLGVDLGGRRII